MLILPLYAEVDYSSEIQPIFDSRCTNCHSGSDAEEDLSLTSYNNVMNGGDSGDVIIPYDHANSLLWQYINSGFMPPGTNDLTDSQVNLIAQWIDEGALAQPGPSEGCTDPEAYNCADDGVWTNYIFDIGGTMYDNSCNWDWNLGAGTLEYVGGCDYGPDDLPDDFANPDHCQGYFNDTTNECRYYQSPHGSEVVFNLTQTPIPAINVNWSTFNPPANATLVSYHVQRCVGSGCIWIADFEMNDENTGTFFTDNYDFVIDAEIKYAIAVKYSNNPYWGWAIGASYIYPPEPGNINGDGDFNVLDIVALANCVLAQNCGGS